MNILFIHQNFPAQFKFLAPELARQGHRVVALTMQKVPPGMWQGVQVVPYGTPHSSTRGMHPWASDFETKAIRGEACFHAALRLRAEGFLPDVVIAHPGWGESLFVQDVWPKANVGIYCEFYYRAAGADSGFDPEFASADPGDLCRLRLKNTHNLLHFEFAKAGLSPTQWQAGTFPEPFRQRITVVHDGIDTGSLVPNPSARLGLKTWGGQQIWLSRQDEVVTFVNRNLEPYRGYHVFMRALPELLASRPNARVLIVGKDGVSYGAPPPEGRKWKDIFIEEVRPRIPAADWARVHFVGHVPYSQFVALLQLSTVHVYLTYPFVLSWSLLEAMSVGCAIVGSDTAPLREAILHDQTGRLVDFFDAAALARTVAELLADEPARLRLGRQARAFAQATYDLQHVCLPRQLGWVQGLA